MLRALALCLPIGLTIGCGGRPPPDPPPSPRILAPPPPPCETAGDCVSEARLARDVEALAISRPPSSRGHAQVREHARAALDAAGFAVELIDYGSGINLIATLEGERDEAIVVSAHYDHVDGCRGADDNASGIAAVLELARAVTRDEQRYARTLILALWDEEEIGLIGSLAWAKAAREAERDIAFAVSLDGIGYADARPGSQRMPPGVELLLPDVARSMVARRMRGDFIAVVGDRGSAVFVEAFGRAAARYELPVESAVLNPLKKLAFGDAQRSDHASFWLQGIPAVMLTDTANYRYGGYHCGDGDDDPERLNYRFLRAVTATLADTVLQLADAPSSAPE